MKTYIRIYGFFGFLQLIAYKIRTKYIFQNARIIRFPIRIRGRKFISVGKGFTAGFNCRLDAFPMKSEKKVIQIGSNVQINDSVHIGAIESIIIGDNVLIASKVFITDHNHGNYSGTDQDSPDIKPASRQLHSKPVVIEKNVWIGEHVSILPGVRIGEGSVVGAMSLVNQDIPPYTISVGSPAKVIKKFNHNSKSWEKFS